MRLILSSLLLTVLLAPTQSQAQSITQNLPGYGASVVPDTPPAAAPAAPTPSAPAPAPTDPFTVTDVKADVTADTAAHARDQALVQAERDAYAQLCARMNVPDSVVKATKDTAIAELVQSFDLQNEKISALRYIGVFTIRFKPQSTQKKLGKYVSTATDASANPIAESKATGPTSHLAVAVQTPSLAVWTQIKRRLTVMPQVIHIDTIDLGRGVSHMDLQYTGSIDELQTAMAGQGFVLLQSASGAWDLADGSMIPR